MKNKGELLYDLYGKIFGRIFGPQWKDLSDADQHNWEQLATQFSCYIKLEYKRLIDKDEENMFTPESGVQK